MADKESMQQDKGERADEAKARDLASAGTLLGARYGPEAAAIAAIGQALEACPDAELPGSRKRHLAEGLWEMAEIIAVGPRHAQQHRAAAQFVMGELQQLRANCPPLAAILRQHLPALEIHFDMRSVNI